MIKLVITDFSGVCSFNEESAYVRDFAKKHNLDGDEFELEYTKFVQQAERDEFDAPELWQKLAQKYQIKIDAKKEIDAMMATKEYYFNVLDYFDSLRKNYKVTMYSNYCKTYYQKITDQIDLSKYFDLVLFSFMVKARKTEPDGFEFILKKFNIKPEEAVFIDDSAKNLTVPQKMGIKTILFEDLEKLKKELKSIGITSTDLPTDIHR